MKTQENSENTLKFQLHNENKIVRERKYIIEDLFHNEQNMWDTINKVEETLSQYKMCTLNNISFDVQLQDDNESHVRMTKEILLNNAGLLLEYYIITEILQPKLEGIYHPRGSYQFPDWYYNGFNIDVKCALVERNKKNNMKYNAPKYNNALEDSSQVQQYIQNFFNDIDDEKSTQFCRSLILYCYYEIDDKGIRILDFIVVPILQVINVTVKDNEVQLLHKCANKNTNACISLNYPRDIEYRIHRLQNLGKPAE